MTSTSCCPACGAATGEPFLRWPTVPVHSCLLVDTETEAREFPRGDLALVFCRACGFIYNAAFDPAHTSYSPDYEETQGFSPRFQAFARDLAARWVGTYHLEGGKVVEIGCGKGEFLVHMAEAGVGQAVGVDPGIHPERVSSAAADRITWVKGFFPEDHPGTGAPLGADAVVCRHTLEHIDGVARFVRQVRDAIADRPETVVLFELPDVRRVLEEGAFWDVYYEHCSYFSPGSLGRLFRAHGFEVLDLTRAYDDQYLLLEARLARSGRPRPHPLEEDVAVLERGVAHFQAVFDDVVDRWRTRIGEVTDAGGRVVIWGSGSKGVAFLAALGEAAARVEAAVDINPYKHGKYLAGTGHLIVGPEYLTEHPPALVVVMNPVYLEEITADLRRLGVDAAVEAL